MKRAGTLVAIVALLVFSGGCMSTLAKSGYREFKQYSTSYLPYEATDSSWGKRYQMLRIEPVTDIAVNGQAPADLKDKVTLLAAEQVAESGYFRDASDVRDASEVLIVRGDIVHFDSGGMGATRTVGFGASPQLVVRTTFIDGATGKPLATANIVSKAESALRDWKTVLGRGHGAALVKYLKEMQNYEKLPVESVGG